MIRFTNQRGVSLMLLIIAITVFAAVAIGIVTLLRSRHESYPYQVQSYEAYALAHAGVEFGARYVMDNQAYFFSNPSTYIPSDSYKGFAFGNGRFELKYIPGCPDILYSRGTCGSAVREVKLANVAGFAGGSANSFALTPTLQANGQYQSFAYEQYTQLRFATCNGDDAGTGVPGSSMVRRIKIASNQPYRLYRFGWGGVPTTWQWDQECEGGMWTDVPLDVWPTAPNGTPAWAKEWVYNSGTDCTNPMMITCRQFNVTWQPNPEGRRKAHGPGESWLYCGGTSTPHLNILKPFWQFDFSAGWVFSGDNWFWIEMETSVGAWDPPSMWQKTTWKIYYYKP